MDLCDTRGEVAKSLEELHAAGHMTNISLQGDSEDLVLPLDIVTQTSSDDSELPEESAIPDMFGDDEQVSREDIAALDGSDSDHPRPSTDSVRQGGASSSSGLSVGPGRLDSRIVPSTAQVSSVIQVAALVEPIPIRPNRTWFEQSLPSIANCVVVLDNSDSE